MLYKVYNVNEKGNYKLEFESDDRDETTMHIIRSPKVTATVEVDDEVVKIFIGKERVKTAYYVSLIGGQIVLP